MSAGPSGPRQAARGATAALTVLTLINLLNYLDRYLVAGVVPKIEAEFGLSHERAGFLQTIFMFIYMIAAPVAGFLGDRIQRRYIVAACVFVWSLATLGTGLATSFVALLAAR